VAGGEVRTMPQSATKKFTKMHKEYFCVVNFIMTENEISNIIIGCAIEVHRALGPGLLESAYEECLTYELRKAGLIVEKQRPMPIVYKEVKLDHGYRMDLLVEGKVVIEIKTVEMFTDVHTAQLLTYLKLGDYRLGLLLNFNVSVLKNGIKRIIN
jgi:GxxExxY protein